MQTQRPALRFLGIGLLIVAIIYWLRPEPQPPAHLNNICVVFHKRPHWYWAAKAARRKWGIPISTQMAIIFRESHFRAGAKPARERLLGLIPWVRPTSADGYAQAVDETWRRYLRETHQRSADRHDFTKATDFIGWYLSYLHRRLNIPVNDAFHLYLAYHEGAKGYVGGGYLRQRHLMKLAQRVGEHAQMYRSQLIKCEKHLPKKHWFSWF